ncbi:MAG: lipoyl(octanoyl) transferase LipB [Bdellovibrio sp.]
MKATALNCTKWTYESEWKGLVPYEDALLLQQNLAEQIAQGRSLSRVLGLEHPHVITLGRRSKMDPVLPPGPIVWTERGGEATLHSEGQLVIYPLMKLRPHFEVRTWVEHLLSVTQRSFLAIGIEAKIGEQSGLWTNQGKIAFLGLRVKNGVSMHGLSINVHNDLKLFGAIKACGVQDALIDSLSNQNVKLSPQEFFQVWLGEFTKRA